MSLNTQDLIAHMQACLGYSPREIKANGRWHDAGEGKNKNKLRYCVTEKTYVRQSEGNNAGEVVTVTVCTYRDYRSADGWHVWKSNEDRSYMSGEELAKLRAEIARKEREEEERKAKAAAEAARKAAFIWSKATKADANHPYLLKKQIKPFGIRQWNGWLYSWQGYRDFAAMAIALHQAANHLRKPGNSVNPAAGASTNVVASRYNRSPSRAVRIARAARGHRKRGYRGH